MRRRYFCGCLCHWLLWALALQGQAVDANDSSQQYCPTPLSLCANSVVQVTSLSWYCNSPYAYYWGSSAHRNSNVCAYNDKVTFDVTVQVTDDINEVSDIYVSFAVQDSSTESILKWKAPTYLCKNVVGSSCTSAGEYQFSTTIKLASKKSSSSSSSTDDYSSSSSSSGTSDDFCPTLIIGFSTQDDYGYNLGALNMECENWDSSFATWTQNQKSTPREWIRDYGMISGTIACLFAISAFVWIQARKITTFSGFIDPCTNMMELDQYYQYRCPPSSLPMDGGGAVPQTISTTQSSSNFVHTSSHHSAPPPLPLHHQPPPTQPYQPSAGLPPESAPPPVEEPTTTADESPITDPQQR